MDCVHGSRPEILLDLCVGTIDLLQRGWNVFLVVVTSVLWTWKLGMMEERFIGRNFKDLGVEDSSKGGGCKDYYNLD